MNDYYTLKDVASKLKFHPETIRLGAAQGKYGRKMFGEWRFTTEDIAEIERLSECPSGSAKADSTITTFRSVENEFEGLLGQATNPKRSASMTN